MSIATTSRILQRIRSIVIEAAPGATEKISHRMPAFTLDGDLLYFAAFRAHIGIYPPVTGVAKLRRDTSRYRGEKGNLKLPLDQPMPYELIRRVVEFRLKEHRHKSASRRAQKQPATPIERRRVRPFTPSINDMKGRVEKDLGHSDRRLPVTRDASPHRTSPAPPGRRLAQA